MRDMGVSLRIVAGEIVCVCECARMYICVRMRVHTCVWSSIVCRFIVQPFCF